MFNHRQKINHKQMVLTAAQYRELVRNHKANDGREKTIKFCPLVKFFDPFGAGTWLISELDPETGIAFGVCDLGQGFPEIGSVDLNEMCRIGRINRDLWFSDRKTLEEWVEVAEKNGSLAGV